MVHASLPASLIHTGLTQPGDLLDEVTTLLGGPARRGHPAEQTGGRRCGRVRLDREAAAALSEARHAVLQGAWIRVSKRGQ